MSCEDIGEPDFSAELAIDYLRHMLPEPPGCSLEAAWAEHELGLYPVIRLCAEPALGWQSPPMEYVCAYQDLLSRFQLAIDWSSITEALVSEEEGAPAGESIAPRDPAALGAPQDQSAESQPEWREFLQEFPSAVAWEDIEPSVVAALIRRHLHPDITDEDDEMGEDVSVEALPGSDPSEKAVLINGRTPLKEYLERSDRLMSDHPEPLPEPASSKKEGTIDGMPVEEYLEREDRLMSDHPEPLPKPNPLSGLSRMGRLYAESLRNNALGVWKELEESGELAARLARNDEEIQQSYQAILAHNAKNHGLELNDPQHADRLKVLASMAREQVMDAWLVKDVATMEADLNGYVDDPEDEDEDDEINGEGLAQSETTARPSPDSSKKEGMIGSRTVKEYREREDRLMSDHWAPITPNLLNNPKKEGDALGRASISLPDGRSGPSNGFRVTEWAVGLGVLWLSVASGFLAVTVLPDEAIVAGLFFMSATAIFLSWAIRPPAFPAKSHDPRPAVAVVLLALGFVAVFVSLL